MYTFAHNALIKAERTVTIMKVSVILPDDDALRFEHYCKSKGFKKSTLIVRLIREHIDSEHFAVQRSMLLSDQHLDETSEVKKPNR